MRLNRVLKKLLLTISSFQPCYHCFRDKFSICVLNGKAGFLKSGYEFSTEIFSRHLSFHQKIPPPLRTAIDLPCVTLFNYGVWYSISAFNKPPP